MNTVDMPSRVGLSLYAPHIIITILISANLKLVTHFALPTHRHFYLALIIILITLVFVNNIPISSTIFSIQARIPPTLDTLHLIEPRRTALRLLPLPL